MAEYKETTGCLRCDGHQFLMHSTECLKANE